MLLVIAYKNPRADNPDCRHSGLGITASNLAEVLHDHGIAAVAQPVVDGYQLRQMLRADRWPGITHVALCAPFFDTAFLETLCREFPHIEWTVTYHSNWGFLQVDTWAVRCLVLQMNLQNRVRNFRISGNCREFCDSLGAAFRSSALLLPNLFYLHGQPERKRQPWSTGDLHLGIFGATRVLKNLVTASVSALVIGKQMGAGRTLVHISSGRVEHGDRVVETVRELFRGQRQAELVEEPWQAWPDFQMTVRWMDLLLQPSFTESFNNVTADGVSQGVASVVGYPISWVPASWRACPDDAIEQASVGCALLADPAAARDGYDALASHNAKALKCWQGWLSYSL